MRSIRKMLAILLVMTGIVAGNAWALNGQIIAIPGFGDVGIEKNGEKYTVALADWGTWDFTGTFKSAKDFDLQTSVPAGDFTKYIPGAGQILSLIGLSTVDLRLKPSGLGVGMTCQSGGLGALRGSITATLSKVKSIGFVVDKIISGFDIRSLVINGALFGKTLKGNVSGEIAIIGKTIKFNEEGEISLSKLVSIFVDKIVPAVSDFAADAAKAAYNKSKDAVVSIGKSGLGKIDKAWDAASAKAKELANDIKYATHSWDRNLNEDLPRFINAQGDPLLSESNKVLDELYRQILPMVRNAASVDERNQLITQVYQPVNAEFDKRWEQLANDRTVTKWSLKTNRENELLKRYREGINAKFQQHQNYRSELYNRFMAAQPVVRIPSDAKTSLEFIAALAKSAVPVVIQLKTENLAWDLPQAAAGNPVRFWNAHGGMNQQWVLVSTEKPDTYFIKCVLGGRYIHISEAKDTQGSNLIIWDNANTELKQTMFTVTADPDGYVRFSTVNGLAFDLQDGVMKDGQALRLWQKNGTDSQVFYVSVPENPIYQ